MTLTNGITLNYDSATKTYSASNVPFITVVSAKVYSKSVALSGTNPLTKVPFTVKLFKVAIV